MRKTTRRYDKYKDSNIEWIGEIPEHWEIKRIKDLLVNGTSGMRIGPFGSSLKSEMMKEKGYKVYGQENVINDDFTAGHRYIDESKFQEMERYELLSGDIVVTMMGTVGKSKVVPENIEKGIMDSHLIRIRVGKAISNLQLLALSINESEYIQNQRKVLTKGSIMEGLNSRIIQSLFVITPPLSEQKAIALYLDTKTAQIDRKIDLLTQKAKRYEELKRAIVNETVTGRRRIDNGELIIDNGGSEIDNGELIMENDGGENCQLSTVNYPLYKAVNYPLYKDSGIKWIGEIPKHWEIKRIKDLLVNGTSGMRIGPFGSSLKSEMMKEKGYKVYGQENVINDDFTAGHRYIDESKFQEMERYELLSGDIVVTMMGTVGKSKVVPENIEKGIMDSHLIRIRVGKAISNLQLLALSINESEYIQNQRKVLTKGSIMEGLNSRIIQSLFVITPPLSEQKAIAHYLDTKTAQIDQIIQTINTQIEKLQELRKTLINDVVTGKIKIIDNGE